jgi:hypothetical protein
MYMKRTQLYLDEEEHRILKRLSRKTGKSVGQLVREAIGEVYCGKIILEKPLSDSDPIWKFIGAGKSPETDVSRRHDHYLYGNHDEDIR